MTMLPRKTIGGVAVFLLSAAQAAGNDLAAQLQDLNANVISADSEQAKALPRMLARHVQARLRGAVRVMDQLGHGERRQHPFRDASSYPQTFRPGRQDYYLRYNVGLQLHTIGDTLIGWMVWDMQRGVDLLLSRRGIDKDRI